VLDPFIGSGTTTKAAMQNERNSIGYETDPNLIPTITKKTEHTNANIANLKIIKR
jgi:DNA modification methylase